ncbi:sumo conjugation enzyme 1 [Striga asiatica]|uniref:Sumo conjugation enzyme 1 n=1 Tax=Striga asiatica TaxID=4170 RepID=A0A5A7Q669_STRAF|nr:sumo conjugation enzyme 1 [Striga asiatica]
MHEREIPWCTGATTGSRGHIPQRYDWRRSPPEAFFASGGQLPGAVSGEVWALPKIAEAGGDLPTGIRPAVRHIAAAYLQQPSVSSPLSGHWSFTGCRPCPPPVPALPPSSNGLQPFVAAAATTTSHIAADKNQVVATSRSIASSRTPEARNTDDVADAGGGTNHSLMADGTVESEISGGWMVAAATGVRHDFAVEETSETTCSTTGIQSSTSPAASKASPSGL